jgi:predicted nucleic acid-binding protein
LIVVDTSVVVKWAVEEDGAEAARQFVNRQPAAPDLLIVEMGHVLTKKVRRRELDRIDAAIAFEQLPRLLEITSSRPLERRAFELSLSLHHSIFDCYFLALAEAAEAELVTADEVFVQKVREMDAGSPIWLLGESAP